MIANCTSCSTQTSFTEVNKGKFKCEKCGSVLHKCRVKDCINMINFGPFCGKCVGQGLKNAGAGAIAVIGVAAGGIVYLLSKGSGNDDKH